MNCRWKVKIIINGETVVICIPLLVRLDRPWPPDDPRAEWMHDIRVNPVDIQDLTVLATLDAVADALSGGLKEQVQTMLKKAAHQVKLPTHIGLEIGVEAR